MKKVALKMMKPDGQLSGEEIKVMFELFGKELNEIVTEHHKAIKDELDFSKEFKVLNDSLASLREQVGINKEIIGGLK